jgi:hypothetical protein
LGLQPEQNGEELIGLTATNLKSKRRWWTVAPFNDVIVIDYSNAKIPWTIGHRPHLGAKSLIVFGEGTPQSAVIRKKMSISQQANRGPNKKAPVLPDASA